MGGAEHPGLIGKLRQIDDNGLPVVSVFCESPPSMANTNVAVDYEAQCYLTTRHLLEMGCRRLAHFQVFDLRYRGFLRAHDEAGIPVQAELVVPRVPGEYPFYIEDGERFTEQLIASKVRFDGIVTESDAQAVGAVGVLLRHGLRVPQDVRVTGVDDSPLALASAVPLTSTTTEMDTCGREAVERLVQKINGEDVSSLVIAPRLSIRASTMI